MQIYAMTDAEGRIIALNPNNMEGNTGWVATTDTALSEHTGIAYADMFDQLTESHGIPLYKMVDGYAENRTQEEIAADIAALPSPEENTPVTWDALAAAYQEGVNEA